MRYRKRPNPQSDTLLHKTQGEEHVHAVRGERCGFMRLSGSSASAGAGAELRRLPLGRGGPGKACDAFHARPGPGAAGELKTHSSRTFIKNKKKKMQMKKLKTRPKGRLPGAGPRLGLLAPPHSWVPVRPGARLLEDTVTLEIKSLWLTSCPSPRLPPNAATFAPSHHSVVTQLPDSEGSGNQNSDRELPASQPL